MNFLEKFQKISKEKKSMLCVGLDPTVKRLNELGYEIREPLEDAPKAYVDFCLDRIAKTGQYALSFKPNRQFLLPLSGKEMRKITNLIHDYNALAIMDHKLSDIGKTNYEALFWIQQEGFDALTVSPFAGNIEEVVKMAHNEFNLGVIMLCLMSNPEATLFMKGKFFVEDENGRYEVYGYQEIAKKSAEAGVDGVVIGATGHVTPGDLIAINRYLNPGMIKVIPGIGTQGGDEKKIITYGGDNLVINVGSAAIFDKDPGSKAAGWKHQFEEIKNQIIVSPAKRLAKEIEETVAALYWEAEGVVIDTQHGITLASGNKSPIYMDGRKVNSHPVARSITLSLANVFVEEVLEKYSRQQIVIAGGETAGAVWAEALATQNSLRYVFFRKKSKGYGTKKRVEGNLNPGDIILFFEDLTTDGNSAVSFVKAAQEFGAQVYKVIVIVNREQGGRQKLASLPIPVDLESMTTLEAIFAKGIEKRLITLADLKEVEEYTKSPRDWNLKKGFEWKE